MAFFKFSQAIATGCSECGNDEFIHYSSNIYGEKEGELFERFYVVCGECGRKTKERETLPLAVESWNDENDDTQAKGVNMTYLDNIFLVAEAAEELGLTAQRVAGLCREGLLPGAQLRGQRVWLIPREAIEAYKANPPKRGRPVTTGAGLARKDRRKGGEDA